VARLSLRNAYDFQAGVGLGLGGILVLGAWISGLDQTVPQTPFQ
jgi:hypothetical protein